MPRIQIELPVNFSFSTVVPVLISHINYAGHLDNAQLLTLVAEARVRFFQSLGYEELNVEGCGIVIADVQAQYCMEIFHGRTLKVEIQPMHFNKYGCDLMWRVSAEGTSEEVAKGKHGILFFDYSLRKPALVPAGFKAAFETL